MDMLSEQASFSARFIAFFIDVFIVQIFSLVTIYCGALIAGVDPFSPSSGYASYSSIFGFLFFVTYFVWFHSHGGQTVGKKIMRIKVVSLVQAEPTVVRAIFRVFGLYLSAIPLFIGFLWPLWDKMGQAWHDKLAGTLVVDE